MAREGVHLLAGLEDLAVMGFAEVVRHLPFFLRLGGEVKDLIRSGEIDLVIPIDYPGFNLRMTRFASRQGVPVLYYISPQVWAWKEGRTSILARHADTVAVILPFEVGFLEARGVEVDFVGHPLIEAVDEHRLPAREEFCAGAGLDPDSEILALFPGSRGQELDRHLEAFVAAGRILAERRPGLQLVLARAGGVSAKRLEETGLPVVEDGRSLLGHARAAIVKSGTTTLEAALAGVPFVVAYRTSSVTFALARRLVRVDHVALANLVAGDRVVPELLQDEVNPEALANAAAPLLDDTPERRTMLDGLAGIRDQLGGGGASDSVADLALDILGLNRGGGDGGAL
jgi:lipid-A-disaccharide synthase